ncbi:MAG: reprolysin-like metallopeptidase [Vicinamibacterales bacterium]
MQFRNLVFCLALISSVGPLSVSAQPPAPRPLFDEPAGAAAAPLAAAEDRRGPRVVRRRAARLQASALDAAARAGLAGDTAPLLELNLFSDVTLRAAFERSEADRLGHRTWVGRVTGDPYSAVTLTWRDQTIVGSVQSAGRLYRIQGAMDAAVVDEVDPATFGEELEPVAVAAEARADVADAPAAADPPQDGEVADILVYYTTAAKNGQGGVSAIQALIATAVADANTAYARSGIAATLRLAGAVEWTGYVESSTDMGADLSALRGNAGVAAARDAAGADLVALIVNATAGGACGVGYLGPSASYAHSVTARTCIVGNYTFAHEVGHNFGSHHAPEDGASGAWQPYGYGYKDYTANFRTVMAYAPGTRILNFSNPAVLHNGRVTGSATQQNAQSLRQAFPIVQGFRTAAGGALGAPGSLAAVVTGNTVSLTWLAPTTGTPTGYVLQAGTAPGAANLFNGAVGLTTAIAAPLPAGVYYARVFAQNAGGVGPASSEATFTIAAPAPPGAPGPLVGSASGSTVSVSWAPPATGGAPTGYLAEVGTSPGAANVLNAAVGLITAASGALPPGTYYIRVRAQNAAGTGPASNEVVVTVGPACTTPAAPVLSGGASGGVISLSWTTPSGGPIAGYTLQAGSASGASNLFNAPVGLTNGLAAGVGPGTYYIRVLATAACGAGAASNQLAVTVP